MSCHNQCHTLKISYLSTRIKKDGTKKTSIDCLSHPTPLVGYFSKSELCFAMYAGGDVEWRGMGWWDEVMMERMCKEFDFMNECDRVQKMWMFISIYGTRKQYSYSIRKKSDGCCTYFIDRFCRESFPIQMNGFAVAAPLLLLSLLLPLSSQHLQRITATFSWHSLLEFSRIFPLHLR